MLLAAILVYAVSAPAEGLPRLLSKSRLARTGERSVTRGGSLLALPAFGAVAPRPDAATDACASAEELLFEESALESDFVELQQSVARLTAGGFAAVWVDGSWGSRVVKRQWLDASGHPLFPSGGAPVSVNSPDGWSAVVAAEPSGGAFVGFTAQPEIFVQSFDPRGAPRWPAPVSIADLGPDLGAWVSEPNLVADPVGGLFVCYQFAGVGQPGESAPLDVRCQHLDASGRRLWPAEGISVTNVRSDDLCVLPRAVPDGAGGLIVIWENLGSLGTGTGQRKMEGQRFSAKGDKPWGPAAKVLRTTNLSATNGYTYTLFQVVSDGHGGAIVGFDDWISDDPNLDVLAQRVSGSGELLWGEGAVVTAAAGQQQHDQTIAAPDGGAVVSVWEPGVGLRLFRLGPDGSHVWTSKGVPLSPPEEPGEEWGAFGSWEDGALRLAFTSQTHPATWDIDVVYSTFAPDATRTGTTFLTQRSDGQFLRGFSYARDLGGVLAVWNDKRRGDWSLMDTAGALFRELPTCPGGLHPIPPCRLLDTREGASPLVAEEARTFLAAGSCGIPLGASALAANVTVVAPEGDGFLTIHPAGTAPPLASALNFRAGATRANNALVRLSFGGAFTVAPSVAGGGGLHLVVDVSGYFD